MLSPWMQCPLLSPLMQGLVMLSPVNAKLVVPNPCRKVPAATDHVARYGCREPQLAIIRTATGSARGSPPPLLCARSSSFRVIN